MTTLIASGCGPSGTSLPTTPTSTNRLLAFTASVSPSQFLVGDSAFASVSGWSTVNGQSIYGPVPVTAWTSANPAVATVDSTGRVTAVGAGSTTLAARHRDGIATAGVAVYTESDIQAVAVSCPATTPLPGGVFCMASGRTSGGGSVPVRATWSTSDVRVGRAESGGPSSVKAERLPLAHVWKGGRRQYDELLVAGVIQPAFEDGDPLEDWPDIRLPRGTAAALIDSDRGDA